MVGKIVFFLSIVFSFLFINKPAQCQMSVKWEWTGGKSLPDHRIVCHTPVVINLTDDNSDMKIDLDDIPDIVFVARNTGTDAFGALHAISGADGSEIFTVTDPTYSCLINASIAVGDIDDDGLPEIIAGYDMPKIPMDSRPIAFEHDGTFKWFGDLSTYLFSGMCGAINIADLDGDGNPEIIMGSQVWDNTGHLKWSGSTWGADYYFSCCADINMDGKMEVIDGKSAYRWDGSIMWTNPAVDYGFTSIADFDLDSYPEIVLTVAPNNIYLLNNDGSIRWGPLPVPGTGDYISTCAIADFDNDKYPEIVVAKHTKLTMFNRNGIIIWTKDVVDNTGAVGPASFDFNHDNLPEIVYADEYNLYIIRGSDGATLDSVPHLSETFYETPVIADIDNDNSADIILVSCGLPFMYGGGVTTYSDLAWDDTRSIWNQYNYRITNVYDLGEIPVTEPYSWLLHNSYRTQTSGSPTFPVSITSKIRIILILFSILMISGQTQLLRNK